MYIFSLQSRQFCHVYASRPHRFLICLRHLQTWSPSDVPTSVFSVTRNNGFLPIGNPLAVLPKKYSHLTELLDDMPLKKADGTAGLLDAGSLGQAVHERTRLRRRHLCR